MKYSDKEKIRRASRWTKKEMKSVFLFVSTFSFHFNIFACFMAAAQLAKEITFTMRCCPQDFGLEGLFFVAKKGKAFLQSWRCCESLFWPGCGGRERWYAETRREKIWRENVHYLKHLKDMYVHTYVQFQPPDSSPFAAVCVLFILCDNLEVGRHE
jgi:hypothetical protein